MKAMKSRFGRTALMLKKISATAIVLMVAGCISTPAVNPGFKDYDANSTANAAAYRADAMEVRRPFPTHDNRHWKFYYKQCELVGDRPYYSKTSYQCTPPD